jgi:hypothetical protein
MPTIVDVRDYKELFRKTREVDRDLNRELKKRLRVAGKIGAVAARTKIREWPVQGGISAKAGGRAHRGLRATIAANIRVSATGKTVQIRSGAQGITGKSSRDVPRDIDRGGWYHPVYGRRLLSTAPRPKSFQRNRANASTLDRRASSHGTVFQTGFPYFKTAIEGKRDEMTVEVAKVLDDVARRLT